MNGYAGMDTENLCHIWIGLYLFMHHLFIRLFTIVFRHGETVNKV